MKRYLLLCIVLTLQVTNIWAQDDTLNRFQAYPLGSADVTSTEQIVKALVGDSGTVLVDGPHARLLVIATDETHRKIAELIKQVDIPPVNVRIDVQFLGRSSGVETDIGISGNGGVVIKNGKTYSQINLQPRLKHQTTKQSSDVTQTLLVMSGREATLQVGEEVPYAEWFLDYGLRWGVIHERIAWKQVGAKLVVTPTVIGQGPMINVRLTPELSGLVEGNPFNVRFARAATEVVIKSGESLQLGGLNKDNDFYSHFLVGVARSQQTQTLDIILTPRIVNPMMP